MGTKPYNLDCSGKRSERVSILGKEIKSTREKNGEGNPYIY
ncbi:hypothetical protein [Methanosarcina horonobensis]|nr:hypothetical protein [Methanosarcina horonobensis]